MPCDAHNTGDLPSDVNNATNDDERRVGVLACVSPVPRAPYLDTRIQSQHGDEASGSTGSPAQTALRGRPGSQPVAGDRPWGP